MNQCRVSRNSKLEPQFTQSGMVIRTPPEQPVIFAIRFQDRKVVDRRKPVGHEAVVIKFPVLIPIRAIPVTRVIVPLVSEADSDPIPGERPEFLDESVVQLHGPLAGEERNNLVSPVDELRAVPPS